MTQTSAESWQRLENIFKRALEHADADRSEFIARECAGDDALAGRIRRMINAHHSNGKLLDSSPIEILPAFSAALTAAPTLVGRRIGSFSITNVIATGGMGTVYLAQQEHPRRRVALKVMLGAALGTPALQATSRSSRRRFEIEADLLGRLQHPAIAQVYEAGMFESDEGPQPYFAMEYIEGRPITQYAQEQNLNVHDRLILLQKVCEGVHHAHGRGVIHRDLKPSNILVDAAGQPKILDFGIARAIDSYDSDHSPAHSINATLRTASGQLMGTVAYMSPEQIAGDAAQIDTQSDVYALGVIGYELLANRLPHDVAKAPLADALRILREHEPTPLSAVWGSVIDRQTQQLSALHQREVCTIIGKALESDKTRRYSSAAEFAADIARFLNDEPILAQPPSTLYQLRKFARRNKTLVAGVIGVVAALMIGVIGTSIGMVRANHAAKEQERLRNVADDEARRATAAEINARRRLDESIKLLTQLVSAYDALSDVAGATKACETLALQTVEHLPRDADQATDGIEGFAAYAHQRLGEVQLVMGRAADALDSHERSLRIRLAQAERHPRDANALRSLAVGQWKVAEALRALGRSDEAQSHNVLSIAVLDRMVQIDPASRDSVHYFAAAHRRIADIELEQGLHDRAKESFAKSVEYFDQQLQIMPTNAPTLQGKAMALRGMGEAELALGLVNEAHEAIAASLKIVEALARDSGQSNVFARTHEALGLLTLSRVRLAMGGDHQAQALTETRKAFEIADALATADAHHADSHRLREQCRAALDDIVDHASPR
jgi:serine/threonine protein kinase